MAHKNGLALPDPNMGDVGDTYTQATYEGRGILWYKREPQTFGRAPYWEPFGEIPIGPPGPPGNVGPQGASGPPGEAGAAGPAGSQGDPGAAGEAGRAGFGGVGPRGQDGATWHTSEAQPAPSVGNTRDLCIDKSGKVWRKQQAHDMMPPGWLPFTSLVGPRGLRGPQGERGPQGIPGAVAGVMGGHNFTPLTITATTTLDGAYDAIYCNNSSDITLNLTTAGSWGYRPLYIKKIGNNTNTITIDGSGSEDIEGSTTCVLYVRYDSVLLIPLGSSWYIFADGRFKHVCRMNRSVAQTIANATVTDIELDQTLLDTGGLADLANDQITIRRPGNYLVQGSTRFQGIDDGERTQIMFKKNGTIFALNINYSPATNYIVYAQTITVASFTTGDDIKLAVYQDEGASLDTDAESVHNVDATPQIMVVEV